MIGTACTGGPCGNSHTLLSVAAEPFVGGTFIDSSSYARVVTNGGVTQSAVQVKFGTQSMENDNIADRISVPDSPDWTLPRNFTIAAWYYLPALANVSMVVGQYAGALDRALFYQVTAAGAPRFRAYDGVNAEIITLVAGNVVLPNQWQYLEVSRDGDLATLWADGLSAATDATAAGVLQDCTDPVGTTDISIGAAPIGYFDAWTITSGGWAWNRNHSPPNRRW